MEKEPIRKPLSDEKILREIKRHKKKSGEFDYEAIFSIVSEEIEARELFNRTLGAEAIKDIQDTNIEDNE